MPQANSTTSMPRWTSPCASENTFAVLLRNKRRQLVVMLIEEFLELEKDPRAFDRRDRAPFIKCGASCRHCHFDVCAAGHRHPRSHFARRRIKDIHLAFAATSKTTAVNEVFEARYGDLAIARNCGFALGLFDFWLHKTLLVFRLSVRKEYSRSASQASTRVGVFAGMPTCAVGPPCH